MSVNHTQTIRVRCQDPDRLVQHLVEWDCQQADADVMGYIGTHLLAARDREGEFLIVAEFASVDPAVPAAEEAARNNDRPETQAWAAQLLEMIDGEPVYEDYDELYRTG